MARRRSRSGRQNGLGLLVMIAVGCVLWVSQLIRENWPIVLVGLAVIAGVWLATRRHRLVGAAKADSEAAVPLEQLQSLVSHQPAPISPDTGPQKPVVTPSRDGAGLSAAYADPIAAVVPKPVVAPSAYFLSEAALLAQFEAALVSASSAEMKHEEPEFRISAIAELPKRAASSGTKATSNFGAKTRWIPKDEVIEIHGIAIAGGMIYVGSKLGSERWSTENCLINPRLQIAPRGRGTTAGMGYWPRYEHITAENRRAYLEWLADGRNHPKADIGLVFLYFYGLEYRLFKEQAAGDAEAIAAEVERLLSIYGCSSSFQTHAQKLLEAAHLLAPGRSAIRPKLSFDGYYAYELPLDVSVWLGTKLAAGQALDADDVLLWLGSQPDRNFRTPVTRCPDEFQALWRLRFDAANPEGLKVKAPKGRIKAIYRAASSTFEAMVGGSHADLPDIGTISAPLKKPRDLAEACTVELEAFSRYVGKRPEAKNGVQASLLLPRELSASADVWAILRSKAHGLLSGRSTACVELSKLLDLADMSVPPTGRVPQATMIQLCQILDRIDLGFEPDRRYGGTLLDSSATVCIFNAPGGAPIDPERADYQMFRGMIEIACLAAASDGNIAPEEIETVLVELVKAEALSPAEKLRLAGYARSIHLDPPKQQAVLKRLADRPLREREACARAALAAVMADGHAAHSEVRFLEKLYKALALPVAAIYGTIHRSGTDSVDRTTQIPVERKEATLGRGHAEPKMGSVVSIDASRLDRIRRETQAVSSLLSDIFVDDDPAGIGTGSHETPGSNPLPETLVATTGAPLYTGLDPVHGELLAALLVAEHLDRSFFDRESRARKLLPDGALETINEWSFDRFGEAVIEDDDDLTIAPHLRDELSNLKAAA